MTELEWRSAQVAYFAQDKDRLILDAVRPALEHCTGQVASAYFVRHWRRGPHLRLVVRATPEAFRETVEPALEEFVGGYLANHPSTAPALDEDRLLPMHRRLAEAEREPGPLTPFYTDNTITWGEHDRRVDVLGCEVGADELALFYTRTNALVYEHLEAISAGGLSRETLALRLMLATAHTLCRHPEDPTIRRGFVSFRSHADGYLSTVDQATREAFDARYAANRETLAAQVRAVVAAFDTAEAAPLVRDWVAALDPLGQRWLDLYEAGEIPAAEIPGDEENGLAGLHERSPLHRAIDENVAYKEMMYHDPRFQRYRLMLNYTYLHMARLGITGLTRYLLCHLAANAVEDVYGVRALDLVLAYTAAHPNPQTAGAPEAAAAGR